ncbi:glucosamine-6-phosphate deaminase [Palleronia sp. LCG004]|uniref:glucosamine-6-phosphate deaminase n=1 Tax=Palleronia sp. LCG004 TaxID=3079304 RepID=UPI0029425FA9|nr:glucosamine-6-phosphate deaminase [Palleronia sp. LCG004]WOI55862.1 glucosamine-6-phosphate deaminase [Palleronia sp. LCG004]
MRVLICPDAASAARRTADLLCEHVARRPHAVLGLATGGTMEPVYEILRERIAEGSLDLSSVTTFNLDEYVGLAGDHPQSYRATMERLLFEAAGIGPDRARLPDGAAADPAAEADAYDAAISEAGGIDLQLLGIGSNGHIGFNEPTSSLGSRTRIKTLTRETRDANARFFDEGEEAPRFSITMGIATVLEARSCLLLATGEGKAPAVAAAIEGPLSAACPASALQLHPSATMILDPDAARDLKLRDYYEMVHPAGGEAPL